MFTPEEIKFLDKFIEDKARQIAQSEIEKFGNLRAWVAIVTSVGGSTASVYLIDDINATIMSNLKNKTGESLSIGDEVELHSISGLTNAVIAVKK